MKRLAVTLVTALLIQLGMPHTDACGDKTMRVASGIRYYQTKAASHPSTILIHSAALPSGKAAELSGLLNDVGHKATAIEDLGTLKTRLATSRYDLVLTNLAEAPQLQKEVESITSKTIVVPVLLQSKSEEQAAGKQYKVIVKNPKRLEDFLIAIVKVMDSRSKKS